jgi:rubrerythrin
MNPYSIREIVEQAVQTEKLGYEYYSSMSGKFADNAELNKLFNTLAGQELQHEKRFAEFKETLKEEQLENWEEASKYLHEIVESEFFLGSNKALTSVGNISTVDEAIRHAISFEKETLLYFYALKDAVQEKDMINDIINQEKNHMIWLSNFGKKIS